MIKFLKTEDKEKIWKQPEEKNTLPIGENQFKQTGFSSGKWLLLDVLPTGKGHKGNFWGDGNIPYLDLSGGHVVEIHLVVQLECVQQTVSPLLSCLQLPCSVFNKLLLL